MRMPFSSLLNTQQPNEFEGQSMGYFRRMNKLKLFHLTVYPHFMLNFQRSRFISILLILLNQLQEIDLLITRDNNTSIRNDHSTADIVKILDYLMFWIDDLKNTSSALSDKNALLYFSLAFNVVVVSMVLLLFCFWYANEQLFPQKARFTLFPLSVVVKCYNYVMFLPFISISVQVLCEGNYFSKSIGIFNIVLTLALSKRKY